MSAARHRASSKLVPVPITCSVPLVRKARTSPESPGALPVGEGCTFQPRLREPQFQLDGGTERAVVGDDDPVLALPRNVSRLPRVGTRPPLHFQPEDTLSDGGVEGAAFQLMVFIHFLCPYADMRGS